MKKVIYGAIAGVAMLLAVSPVFAATTTNITVYPTSTIFGSNNVVGDTEYATGFQFGSFASNGTSKTDMYFAPSTLFGRDITLGEITSMSYWTKTGATHTADPRDWFINIYTQPYSGDVSTPTWYGDRIGTEPYFSININDPANTWNNWTTGGTQNKLRFFESTQGAPGATFGSYTDPDWSTFVGGNSLSGQPYSGHSVLYFSVQTGSAWATGFTGKVDGLTITLSDGSVATVNFESVADSDGDGILNDVDACLGTTADGGWSEQWGTNRWQVQDDFSWYQNKPGKKGVNNPTLGHGIDYTYGCNGHQILDLLNNEFGDLMNGHRKFGLSTSVLEDFHKDMADRKLDGRYLIDTVTIPANKSTTTPSNVSLLSGHNYILEAVGTWTNSLNVADTEYASTDAWVSHFDGYDISPWLLGLGEFDLKVDGGFVDWGAYSTTHTYSLNYSGIGSPVNFLIFDGNSNTDTLEPSWYADNSGNLTVNIYAQI